jgi:hypothetical protein
MKNFRDLTVWQRGHELALAVYRDTQRFPKEELFGLTSPTAAVRDIDPVELRRRLWPRH